MIKASLIISFFQRIDYLRLVMAGLERQTLKDFEIIIADDGSQSEIVKEIEDIAKRSSILIKHVWHEDRGFRKNKILNQAISTSDSEYMIFIDGDCIPHRNFVQEHIQNSSPGTCLTGRRVNLSEKITNKLSEEKVKDGYLEKLFGYLLLDGIIGNSYDVEKGLYFQNRILRSSFNKKKRGLLGCNFSLFKQEMFCINGFDERYEAPSIGEDTDIQYRLELKNIRIKSLNNIAVQYHLYHKLQMRPEENLRLFEMIKRSAEPYTPFGIKK